MAANYYDYLIKGDDEKVVSYLEGYFRGKGIKDGYYFSKDYPFRLHFLRELIKYHGNVVHMICRSDLRPAVRSAVSQSGDRLGFEIQDTRKIVKASFEFEFSTANRTVAGNIKRALGRHPAGVKLVHYEPKEIYDPGAKGSEGYAPLHEYSFTGKGVIEGVIDGVIRSHKKLSSIEFIECNEIDLHR